MPSAKIAQSPFFIIAYIENKFAFLMKILRFNCIIEKCQGQKIMSATLA